MKSHLFMRSLAVALGACLAFTVPTISQAANSTQKLEVARVGLLPNAETAAIRLGDKKGFFKEAGIDLKITDTSSGAAAITALIAGQFDVVFANTVSVMQGRDKGLPLIMVDAASTSTGINGKDFSALVVSSKSKFKTAKDLSGKTIASNTVKNIGEVTARLSVAKAGGDAASVKVVEMPFSNMEQALESGQIDAAWMVEPFHTTAKEHGLRDIASNYVDTAPHLTAAAFVSTDGIVKSKADMIKRFRAAMAKTADYANSHPKEIREIIPTFTKITPEIANTFVIPRYDSAVNVASLEAMLPEMRKLGMISKNFKVESVIYK
ncbi:MAG TPA: ABC transporter substrate-binding protein [Castellaniella sp.]|uniref:ABC transporter substrate-binding protein n=1 Tax=Castellaniella sp. TaxID=1955812 RepID=UPI002F16A926